MASKYIEGVGLISIDQNKSEEEQQATIDYWRSVTPKQKDLTFSTGWNDNQSMIYRQFEQEFLNTDDENKRQWFEDQAKDFGQNVGYYDSIALENYFGNIKKSRPLTEDEDETRTANMATMQEFQRDMYNSYENKSGDITEVQEKYGYTPEEISVMDGLVMMAQNPSYTAGSLASMVAKDPELLLLSYLRIPAAIAKTNQAIMKTAQLATKIKPSYVRKFENSLGRGAEGAVYGATYEALHDLTFNGHIDPDNIERGAAAGALLGTAFGVVTKASSGSWFTDRVGSKKASKKIDSGKSGIKSETKEGKTTFTKQEKPIKEPVKVDTEASRKSPNQPPKGLTHENRYTQWRDYLLGRERERLDAWAIENNISVKEHKGKLKVAGERIDKRIESHAQTVKDMFPDISKAEAKGLGSHYAAALERRLGVKTPKGEHVKALEAERVKMAEKEANWGREAIQRGDETPPPESFAQTFEAPLDGQIPKATASSLMKWGVGGAVAGYAAFDENPVMSSLIGGALGVATRGRATGVNINKLKLRQHVYKTADQAKVAGKDLESGSTQLMINIKRAFDTPKAQRDFVFVLEKPTKKSSAKAKAAYNERMAKMTPEQREVVNIWHKVLKDFKKIAIKEKIFDKGIEKEYVTHIFKGKEMPKDVHKKFSNILNTTSKFGKQRELLKTIEEINASGKYDIVTDPLELLSIYTHSMSKAIIGAKLVNGLKTSAILDGETSIGLIIPRTEKSSLALAKKLGYKTSDHPALRESWVHPIVKDAIEDFYHVDVGTKLFMDKVLIVNNAMKRLAVSMSLFHAQALMLSGMYAGMFPGVFTKTGKARLAKVREIMDAKWDAKTGDFAEGATVREFNTHGVEVGHMKTASLVNPGYDTVKNFFDKYLPRVSKVQDKVDTLTWTKGHDQMKIYTYLLKKEQAMKAGVGEFEAGAISAEFVNDAFGGLNWQKLAVKFQDKALKNADNPKGLLYDAMATATAPSKLKWANLGVFAPDWTIANFRIAFRAFGMGKDLAAKVIKGKKLSPKEKFEFSMYSNYLVRAGITTTMMAYALHEMFSDEDEFDFEEFWMRGRLNLGKGQEMVVSKQIAEPIHWLTSPMHTLWNKSASLPKMMVELTAGKEYVSFKHGALLGPKLERGDPMKMLGYAVNKITPISFSPAISAIRSGETSGMLTKTVSGAAGFPIYGKKQVEVPQY